jgi:hypothetical protein
MVQITFMEFLDLDLKIDAEQANTLGLFIWNVCIPYKCEKDSNLCVRD